MKRTILLFLTLYPVLIFPYLSDYSYTRTKYMYLVAITVVVLLYMLRKFLRKELTYRFRTPVLLWLLFLFLVILSTLFSVDMAGSYHGAPGRKEGTIALIGYGVLFVFIYLFLSKEDYPLLLKAFVFVSGWVAIYAILQHFQLDFFPRDESKQGYSRSYAFFGNPNFYGSYVTMMLMLGMGLYLRKTRRTATIYYFAVLSLLFASMLYSATRSAWIGSFIGFLFLSYFVVRKRELWWKWLFLCLSFSILFVGISIIESGATLDRTVGLVAEGKSALQGDQHAGSSRLYIWRNAVPLIPDYFWLGSGPDTFAEVFPDRPEEKAIYFNGNEDIIVDKAHNEYLHIAVTMGVPALLVYLILVGWLVVKGVRRTPSPLVKRAFFMEYGVLAAVMAYLVQAFFNISVITVAPFFWVLLGIVGLFTKGHSKPNSS